ncbi:hypothetical protein ABT314_48880, partial [Streptomyces spiralis]
MRSSISRFSRTSESSACSMAASCERQGLHRPEQADARVVHQHVEPAQLVHRTANGPRRLPRIC